MSYDAYDQVRYLTKGIGAHLGAVEYSDQVTLQAFIPIEEENSFAQMFEEMPQVMLRWAQVVLRVPEEGK